MSDIHAPANSGSLGRIKAPRPAAVTVTQRICGA
jgi:hypothetical protein